VTSPQPSIPSPLSDIPIVDHHAHPLLRPESVKTAAAFKSWFTESTDLEIQDRHVPNTLFFRTAIRWLAERLDCEPALESVLEARAGRPYAAWTRELFAEVNIELLYCDYGYGGGEALQHEEMQALLPCPVRPILRLETLAEDLILKHNTFGQAVDAFVAEVSQARANGYVALKSIIAYRSGLAIGPATRLKAADAFVALKEEARRGGRVRLTSKPLSDYLVNLALEIAQEQELPLQFHTGFGDSDGDLRRANPLHLRPVIESYKAPLVLLHAGWPFYRETAHLAALYPHVWLDLSLAIPLATAGIPAMLASILGMAPFSKILFATDAFTMPEIYWLAARWGRWGLSHVFESFVSDGLLARQEVRPAAEAILGENARHLYG
jgi:predicted TIM-barrel fold metal-dependent hydrolase